MAFDANNGKLLWEHRFNVYLSDVPPHRVGWASPVGDPATGNVYVLGVGGNLLGLNRDGRVLWERSLGEDFGLLTTHGGRTVSPIIDGDLVIVEQGRTPQTGDVVAALIDNESTLKTYMVRHGKPVLRAENPKYPNLIPSEELVIQGVFRALIRRAKE